MRRTELENQANGWVRDFEQPSENFQIGVDEALFFNNNDRVENELLRDSDDQLLGRLAKAVDQQSGIEQLWLTVLNRPPQPEEMTSASLWLERTPDNSSASRRQLLWALLAGAEFRFNH